MADGRETCPEFERGAAAERDAVAAYLREVARRLPAEIGPADGTRDAIAEAAAGMIGELADAVERGEHRR